MKATGSSKTTLTINRHGVISQKTHVFIIKSCLKPAQSQNSFTPKFFGSMNDILSNVYGPFFFADATVTGPVYLDMFEQFLEPQLLADGILGPIVFQQGWSTVPLSNNCTWLSWQTLPRSLDWSWRNKTTGRTFTRFNTLDFFLPGVSLSLRCTLVEELVI